MKLNVLFLLTTSLYAQANTGGLTSKGVVDSTNAASTAPVKAGTSLPATCAVGELFFKTNATITAILHGCTTTNIWTQQGGVASTNQAIRTIGASFGSFEAGAIALSGTKTACTTVHFAGTIQSVTITGGPSGSVTVDILKVAHASWTGIGSATSIAAAAIPALSSAATFTDSTLPGWTTAIAAETDVCFALSSPTTVTGVAISLKVAAN